jgi:DNA-directed RNA polymerase specialized sigma24 family protein
VRAKSYYNPKEKTRHVPNWPEPTPEQLALFNDHLYLADILTTRYWKKFHFDTYKGFYLEEIKQEICLVIYKCALFFDKERQKAFGAYAQRAVHNRLVNIVRDHEKRMQKCIEVSLEEHLSNEYDEDRSNDLGIADRDINDKKYLPKDDPNILYDDEKEIIGIAIDKLPKHYLSSLNKLCQGRKQKIEYYYKIGKALERAFKDAGMSSDFKQVVDFLLNYYAPLIEEEEFKEQYAIISPAGELLRFSNQTSFCKKNNLRRRKIVQLLNGHIEQYKGYRLYEKGEATLMISDWSTSCFSQSNRLLPGEKFMSVKSL